MIPALPPITEYQQTRYEYLITDEGVNRAGRNSEERTSLIFLYQAHLFKNLIELHPNSIALEEYIRLCNSNYEAYLKYIK